MACGMATRRNRVVCNGVSANEAHLVVVVLCFLLLCLPLGGVAVAGRAVLQGCRCALLLLLSSTSALSTASTSATATSTITTPTTVASRCSAPSAFTPVSVASRPLRGCLLRRRHDFERFGPTKGKCHCCPVWWSCAWKWLALGDSSVRGRSGCCTVFVGEEVCEILRKEQQLPEKLF